MKAPAKGNRYLTWTLRILLILMILFWMIFSLDVFEENVGFWDILLGFIMHNIPVFIMIIILVIAWKRENIGGLLLMLAIVGFAIFFFVRSGNFMWGTLVMVGIPFLIGALFVGNHYYFGRKQ